MVVFCGLVGDVAWINHKRTKEILYSDGELLYLALGIFTQVYLFGKNIWNFVHFIIYRLNFNKEVFITSQFSNHIFPHMILFQHPCGSSRAGVTMNFTDENIKAQREVTC